MIATHLQDIAVLVIVGWFVVGFFALLGWLLLVAWSERRHGTRGSHFYVAGERGDGAVLEVPREDTGR